MIKCPSCFNFIINDCNICNIYVETSVGYTYIRYKTYIIRDYYHGDESIYIFKIIYSNTFSIEINEIYKEKYEIKYSYFELYDILKRYIENICFE